MRNRPDSTITTEFIDVAETRRHLIWLASKGIGIRRISQATGLAKSTITDIRSGKTKKTTSELAIKVLALNTIQLKPRKVWRRRT